MRSIIEIMMDPLVLISLGVSAFLLWRLHVLETNFASHTDYLDNKVSEIDARLDKEENFTETMADMVDKDLTRCITFLQYQCDYNAFLLQTHNQEYYHLDKDSKPVKLKFTIEDEITTLNLAEKVKNGAEKLGFTHLKNNRPQGE